MNNYGILYKKEDGKFYLYSSYPTVDAMTKALKEDEEVQKLGKKYKDHIYLLDITNCPLDIKGLDKEKEDNNTEEEKNGTEEKGN